jgi:hypothetical protein
VHVGSGPAVAPAARTGVGFTGAHALHYATTAVRKARAGLFDMDVTVTERTDLIDGFVQHYRERDWIPREFYPLAVGSPHYTIGSAAVRLYTLTPGGHAADPRSWELEGSPLVEDGPRSVLDERQDQTFGRRRQTRAFVVREPAPSHHYRLRVTATDGPRLCLAQVELLADATGGDS